MVQITRQARSIGALTCPASSTYQRGGSPLSVVSLVAVPGGKVTRHARFGIFVVLGSGRLRGPTYLRRYRSMSRRFGICGIVVSVPLNVDRSSTVPSSGTVR